MGYDLYGATERRKTTAIKTINPANGVPCSENLFQITGTVKIKSLLIQVTTTLGNNLTVAFFDLWDSTASVLLSANGGALSLLPAGSIVGKLSVAGSNFDVADSSVGVAIENATLLETFKEVVAIQKTGGANTFIRLNYTTGGAATVGAYRATLVFEQMSSDGNAVAV